MDVRVVTPGEVITGEAGFLRGHGTYFDVAEEDTAMRLEDEAQFFVPTVKGEEAGAALSGAQ